MGQKLHMFLFGHKCIIVHRFGAESPTSNFAQCRPLTMAATLEGIVDEKLYLNAKLLCAKFGYRRPARTETEGQRDRQDSMGPT